MNKLMSYLPKYYADVDEMRHLTSAEVPEISNLWESIESVRQNQFISTSDSTRLRLWERLIRIRPDFATQSLEYRREVVLLRLALVPPLSYRWLEGLLNDRVGLENYSINLDHDRYRIQIQIIHEDVKMISELRSFFRHTLPANMCIVIERVSIKKEIRTPIITTGFTMTHNRHLATVVKRDRVVKENSEIELNLVGITKTTNKHVSTTTERARVVEEKTNFDLPIVSIVRTVNNHSFIAIERPVNSLRMQVIPIAITKGMNRHSFIAIDREIKIKEKSEINMPIAGIIKTINKHTSEDFRLGR